jgi:hypothetical protein
LGWRIHRIWSTDWIRDPEGELQRVLDTLSQIRAERTAAAAQSTAAGTDVLLNELVEVEPPRTSRPPDADDLDLRVYRQYEAQLHPMYGDFQEEPAGHIVRCVVAVVQAEGPIHEKLLLQRVSRAYGIQRVGTRVEDKIRTGINAAARAGSVQRHGEFFWPQGMAEPTPRRPESGTPARPIEYIAPEEIRAAAERIVAMHYHMPHPALTEETARLLGYQRLGPKVEALVGEAIRPLYDSDEDERRAG